MDNYRKPFRTDWSGKGQWAAVATALNGFGKFLNGMRGENGVEVSLKHDGPIISADLSGSGDAYSFQLTSLVDGVATFALGHVMHGTRSIKVGGGTITVSGGTEADPVYVAVEYTPGGDDGSAQFVGPLSAYPSHTPTVLYRVLASFYMVDGVPTLLRVHHKGDIDFTAVLPP